MVKFIAKKVSKVLTAALENLAYPLFFACDAYVQMKFFPLVFENSPVERVIAYAISLALVSAKMKLWKTAWTFKAAKNSLWVVFMGLYLAGASITVFCGFSITINSASAQTQVVNERFDSYTKANKNIDMANTDIENATADMKKYSPNSTNLTEVSLYWVAFRTKKIATATKASNEVILASLGNVSERERISSDSLFAVLNPSNPKLFKTVFFVLLYIFLEVMLAVMKLIKILTAKTKKIVAVELDNKEQKELKKYIEALFATKNKDIDRLNGDAVVASLSGLSITRIKEFKAILTETRIDDVPLLEVGQGKCKSTFNKEVIIETLLG